MSDNNQSAAFESPLLKETHSEAVAWCIRLAREYVDSHHSARSPADGDDMRANVELAALREPPADVAELARQLTHVAYNIRHAYGSGVALGGTEAAICERAATALTGQTPADVAQLMKFYSVDTYDTLVRIQAEHIERLQKKLPPLRDQFPRVPREG